MKWRNRRGSTNIEDRRTRTRRTAQRGGSIGIVALLLFAYFFGIPVTPFLSDDFYAENTEAELEAARDDAAQFVSVVLADTETAWQQIFASQLGRAYEPPILVLFHKQTSSPCGGANGATGPFYCPADRKAYLDTNFFVTLESRLNAGGDFAAAYVVAHEVAHHVQNILGILGKANQLRAQLPEAESNEISVRLELQADCFAGIWARFAQDRIGVLEPGDIHEAMNAARRVGDDTLQAAGGRIPMPHTFTHGTSDQREGWFLRGYQAAEMAACDTFASDAL